MRSQFVILLLLAGGCAHKQNNAQIAPVRSQTASGVQPGATLHAQSRATTCTRDAECGAGQLCMQGQCADAATLAACAFTRVHFDLDRSELNAADRERLALFERCMKAEATTRFQIAGNCDERGTEEYNLALGDRRAHAVVDYLASLGADRQQMRPVSYGKLYPICEGHDESCWQENRRADVKKDSSQAWR